MLYGTSFVAARYAGIRDFLHAATPSGATHATSNGPATGSKPTTSERILHFALCGADRFERSAPQHCSTVIHAIRQECLVTLGHVHVVGSSLDLPP